MKIEISPTDADLLQAALRNYQLVYKAQMQDPRATFDQRKADEATYERMEDLIAELRSVSIGERAARFVRMSHKASQ